MKFKKSKAQLACSFENSITEANGIKEDEIEYEIYGRYVNLTDISNLSKSLEFQEQYNIMQEAGSLRVRYVKTSDNEEAYVMTSKQYDTPDGSIGVPEVNITTTEEMFQHFKNMAQSGLIKNRYFIPIGKQKLTSGELVEIAWEVDVFLDGKGEPTGWVKVDLPVLEELKELPPLPFDLEDKLELPLRFSDRSDEDKKKVRKILDSVKVVGKTVSLESGDMMAYKRTEAQLDANEFSTGMDVEFENDRYVDCGPCDMTYIDYDDGKFTFQRLDEDREYEVEIDLADITLTKNSKGSKLMMVS